MLDSKSQIEKYINSDYTKTVKNILDSIKECSENQFESLLELVDKGANALLLKDDFIVDFDRRLLGLDEAVKKEAEDNITGTGYFVKGIWDFFLCSIKEWNASSRAAARDVLKRELISTIEITKTAIIRRNRNLFPLKSHIISRIQEQKWQIEEQQRNKKDLLNQLRKRLSEVEGLYEMCERVEKKIKNYTGDILSASERVNLLKRRDFKAYLVDIKGNTYTFKLGRLEGTLICFNLPELEWREIIFETNECKIVYYPQKTSSQLWVNFKENDNNIQFIPSFKPHRMELHLTTMTGKLRGR